MSLSLLQGYSSAEEEAEDDSGFNLTSSDDDDQDLASAAAATSTFSVNLSVRDRSLFELPQPSSNPDLPSAFDAFSEVSGPPKFLNNSVEEYAAPRDVVDQPRGGHGGRRIRKEKKDLPTGAVLEAKAQLVGIHERVRSDVENNQSSNPSISNTTQEGKRVATAANPNPVDAAELLRMCLHCGIPKTFSNARGMFCPLCGDRPPEPEPDSESKKKGSTVKDKEKVKRMRGQSSHATWKTESEMQLRQQFD